MYVCTYIRIYVCMDGLMCVRMDGCIAHYLQFRLSHLCHYNSFAIPIFYNILTMLKN